MMDVNDGGQIAPCMETDGPVVRPFGGMTLRDWFAEIKGRAYAMADAMLEK